MKSQSESWLCRWSVSILSSDYHYSISDFDCPVVFLILFL